MTRLADHVYRVMLLAFPAWFRRRHALGMTEQFRAQRLALTGRPFAAAGLWVRAAFDVAWNAVVVRREGPAPYRCTRGNVTSAPFAFMQDARYAARSLRRDLIGTTIIIAILTAGIAANAIMFSIVDQLLLSPPSGVGNPETVRRVFFGSERHGPSATVDRDGYPQAAAVRDGVEAFEVASVTSRLLNVSLGTGTEARPAVLQLVDASYFPVLGLRPAFGRFFADAESRLPDGSPVVVLSHGFWLRNYAGDPAVIGSNLRVEGRLMTIVGVGPPGFRGIDDRSVDVWTPVSALAPTLVGSDWATHPGYYQFGVVVRLRSGTAAAVADAQATAVYRRTGEGLPIVSEGRTAFTIPLEGLRTPSGLPPVGQVSLWLLAVAVLVFLVAIANVAGLLLTRTLSRRREIAVRVALGVSKSRLVRQFVTESALLTGLALTTALGAAWLGGHLVQQVLLPGHSWDSGVVDARVMAVALAMATITVFAVSMAPGLQALSTDLSSSLRTTPRVTGGHAGAVRTGLLVGQVALCVVLLVGAGLFVRSLSAALARDVGMDLGLLVHARLPVRPGMALTETVDQYSEAADRIRQIPGVQGVTITRSSGPMAGSSGITIRRRDWTLDDTKGRRMPALFVVDRDYFEKIGAMVERGRGFAAADETPGERVAIVNRAMQTDFWPQEDPVGDCIRVGSDNNACTPVVGVVENVLLFSRLNTEYGQLYLLPSHPFAARARPSVLLIRLSQEADPRHVLPTIRRAVQSVSPDMPFVQIEMLETVVSPQLQPWRLGSYMFMAFGVMALLISAAGLYGTMAHAVSQRRHEIGVRVALGASRWHVVSQIGQRGAGMVVAGTVLGLLAAGFATQFIAELLYETSPRDPLVFASVAVVLALAGVVAAVVPARRSASIDPIVVLRAE